MACPSIPGKADSLNIYFVPYADRKFQFEPAAERLSLKGDLAYDGVGGGTTSTLTGTLDVSTVNGTVGGLRAAMRPSGRCPDHAWHKTSIPLAMLETGDGVDYVSAANNAGCETCHTTPYLKHGYIYAQIDHDPATDFYTCKACHLDNGEGGLLEWQLLVDDPALAASFFADEEVLTDEQKSSMPIKPPS